jgi:formylglycine-generating enzyme required for sulfatase activity
VLSLATCLKGRAQTQPTLTLQTEGSNETISVTAEIGCPITVQFSTELTSGVWLPLTHYTMSINPTPSTDSAAGFSNRFYRALVQVLPNMAWVSPGNFIMGSPSSEAGRGPNNETQHSVVLTKGFFIGRYLVTQAAYRSLVHTNPSYFNANTGFGSDLNRPVEQVSWTDASNFCNQLTLEDRSAGGIFEDWSYRLATEAAWETACRAGTTNALYFGTNLLSGMANFDGRYEYRGTGTVFNASGTDLGRTIAVGGYQANALGLFDMSGNDWEWVQDWYAAYSATPVTNPSGPLSGTQRIFRGGAFNATGAQCRSANRNKADPTAALNTIGFRVVLSGP